VAELTVCERRKGTPRRAARRAVQNATSKPPPRQKVQQGFSVRSGGMNIDFGDARVSTVGQSLDSQLDPAARRRLPRALN